jgi:NADH-quinone oxidoreductase subunit G
MLDKPQKTYWLHQVDPMLDVADPKKAYMNLKNAFVIAVTSYDTTGIRDCADIMLPLAAVAESPGSYVNYQGLLQSFSAATCPRGEAKQGWTIYQVLASLLSIDAPKNYESLNTLVSTNYHETQWQAIESYPLKRPEALKASWLRIGLASWVRGDMQARHAKALQEAYPIDHSVYVHAEDYDAIQPHLSQAKVSKAVAKGAIVYERGQVFYNTSMGEVTVDEGVA